MMRASEMLTSPRWTSASISKYSESGSPTKSVSSLNSPKTNRRSLVIFRLAGTAASITSPGVQP